MKSYSKILFLLSAGALAWVGCDPKTVPVGAYSAPVSTPDQTLVVNFDVMPPGVPILQNATGPITDTSGYAVTMFPVNAFLFESQVPGNVLQYPGKVQVVNNFTAYENSVLSIERGGAHNTPFASHVVGVVNDPGISKFPAVDYQVPMESGEKYNMSFFTGVQFYFKTSLADSAGKRVFEIPTLQTQTSPAGNCDNSTSKCYDHFSTPLSGTNGSWQPYSIKFTDMTRGGFGWPMVGPQTLSGVNLQQVLWLQWEEGNNNILSPAGGTIIDFWVDEVQFFQ